MRLTTVLMIAATAAAFTLTGGARAELLVYEGFDYAPGDLSGQGGGTGFAAGSTWTGGEVVAGSLGYTDGQSNELPTTGNHALISAAGGSQSLYRALSRSYGGAGEFGPGTYWASFVGQRLEPHATLDENSIRSHGFQLHNGEGDERVTAGKATTVSPVSTNWSIFSDGSGALGDETSSPIHDQTFVVMQVDIADSMDGNNSDTAAMWINPSLDGALGAPDGELTSAAGNNFDYLFDTVRLWAGGDNDDGPYAEWTIDEIRIGTFLEDVIGGVIVEGDTNGDGIVDADDLTPIRTNYRQSVSLRSEGDLNGDGQVTLTDFRQFKNGLLAAGGALEGLDTGFLSVPEPAGALLLAAGVVGLVARRKRRAATWALAALALLTVAPAAQAVTVTGDPEFGYNGVGDATPTVFTVDPDDEETVESTGARGVVGNRMLRQTFKNPTSINVGEIVIGFDVTGGSSAGSENDTGLGLRIYEVEDVNAGEWAPLGQPLAEILFTDTLPGSDSTLSFALDQGEVFELPARSEGTTGYGIEISTPFALASDGNPGLFRHTFVEGTDFYPDGDFYIEDGGSSGGSSSTRDIGLSIIPTSTTVCIAGDTNCDNVVDVDIDLAAIADHFRQEVSLREEGDLTADGFVDFDDFDEWKTNFSGSTEGLDLGFLTAVPEPGSAALMALGAATLLGARRRSKGGVA